MQPKNARRNSRPDPDGQLVVQLLGNHFHLFLRTPEGGLSPGMRQASGVRNRELAALIAHAAEER